MLDKDSTLLYRDYNVILTVQGDGGTDFDQKMVRVYANPMVNFNIQPAQVMVPHAVIRCFNSTPGDGNQYNWYFGDGGESSVSDPVYKYVKSGTYNIKLVVTSINKCQDSATNFVIVRDSGRIDFPNAFLPNMSGPQGGAYNPAYPDNSIFFPYCEGVAEYHLEIFNRWGELLYISDDVTIGWDGYYKGKLCTQGVYVYKAKGKFYNGQSFMKAGDVTLLLKKRL
jgi:gliding motility-associated-like protein